MTKRNNFKTTAITTGKAFGLGLVTAVAGTVAFKTIDGYMKKSKIRRDNIKRCEMLMAPMVQMRLSESFKNDAKKSHSFCYEQIHEEFEWLNQFEDDNCMVMELREILEGIVMGLDDFDAEKYDEVLNTNLTSVMVQYYDTKIELLLNEWGPYKKSAPYPDEEIDEETEFDNENLFAEESASTVEEVITEDDVQNDENTEKVEENENEKIEESTGTEE